MCYTVSLTSQIIIILLFVVLCIMHSQYINQSLICRSKGLDYVRQHLDQMAVAGVEQVGQQSSDEDDFFSSKKS